MKGYKRLDANQREVLVDKVKGILKREYSRTLYGTGPVKDVSIWTEDRWNWVGTVTHASGAYRRAYVTVLGLVDTGVAVVYERGSGEHEVLIDG